MSHNANTKLIKVDYAGLAKCVASSGVNIGVRQANVFGVHNSPCEEFLLTSYKEKFVLFWHCFYIILRFPSSSQMSMISMIHHRI